MQTPLQKLLQEYLAELKKYPNSKEVSFRTPFHNFIDEFAEELGIKKRLDIKIIQEDRDSGYEVKGTPDFFVYRDYNNKQRKSLIGFIECKKPDTDLEKVKGEDQIKGYAKTTDNIILTDYKRFILLRGNTIGHDITVSKDSTEILQFKNLLEAFYNYEPPPITTKKSLVTALAEQSFYYSVELRKFMENEQNKQNPLYIKLLGMDEGKKGIGEERG